MYRQAMGKEGLLLAVIVSLAMAAIAFFIDTPVPGPVDTGICCTSPNVWGVSPFWGWFLNLVLLFLTTGGISWINKEYRIINNSDTVVTGMFMLMAASNVWVSGMLTSTLFVAVINLVCLGILFGCYRQRNATREIFVIGTLLAIGSMYEYAVAFMIPVYIIGAVLLECFSFKALIAYLMGLAAPYWIGIGFGWLPLDGFRGLSCSHIFNGFGNRSELLVGLLNVGLTVLLAFMLALSNSVRLYVGNSRRRVINMVIILLGAVCFICMIFDFGNLIAYLATFYAVTAFQLANGMELSKFRSADLWLFCIAALYIGSFVLMICL